MSYTSFLKPALLLITLALPMLTACSPTPAPTKDFDWKEEILLHDGRKIIAERLDTLGGWAEPGQEGAPQLRRITFPDPNESSKTYTHTITGSSNYLLLDFDKGTPWLIVHVGPFSTDTRCPIGTYATFTMKEGKWQSVSYAELPKNFVKPNMASGYIVDGAPPGQPTGELRKRSAVLSAATIQYIHDSARRNHSQETAWRLVQTNVHGRPIDCQAYPDKPTSSNTSANNRTQGATK